MAIGHYHPTDPACNFTKEAKERIAKMLKVGRISQIFGNGEDRILYYIAPASNPKGWRMVSIEAVDTVDGAL